MGIYLENSKSEMYLGYAGFFALRSDIARIADPELGRHYKKMATLDVWGTGGNLVAEAYDAQTAQIQKKYCACHPGNPYATKLFDFLYQSDSNGSIDTETCEELLRVITRDTDEYKEFFSNIYGRSGGEYSKGSDFIQILRECIEEKENLKWE